MYSFLSLLFTRSSPFSVRLAPTPSQQSLTPPASTVLAPTFTGFLTPTSVPLNLTQDPRRTAARLVETCPSASIGLKTAARCRLRCGPRAMSRLLTVSVVHMYIHAVRRHTRSYPRLLTTKVGHAHNSTRHCAPHTRRQRNNTQSARRHRITSCAQCALTSILRRRAAVRGHAPVHAETPGADKNADTRATQVGRYLATRQGGGLSCTASHSIHVQAVTQRQARGDRQHRSARGCRSPPSHHATPPVVPAAAEPAAGHKHPRHHVNSNNTRQTLRALHRGEEQAMAGWTAARPRHIHAHLHTPRTRRCRAPVPCDSATSTPHTPTHTVPWCGVVARLPQVPAQRAQHAQDTTHGHTQHPPYNHHDLIHGTADAQRAQQRPSATVLTVSASCSRAPKEWQAVEARLRRHVVHPT
jgi:hypothetical protein